MFIKINRVTGNFLPALLFLLFVQFASAQTSPTSEQITAKTVEYMNAAVKTEHFSGSILIAKNGQPIVSKGFGMANYELNVPNSPDTIFRLGSITKQFTATAILQLQEKGKLTFNDSICKYLENCPQAWQPITIRNLLTHTSGIVNYTSLPDFIKSAPQPFTNEELVAKFKDKPLDFPVGEKFSYSNSGYHLLGMIVEKASGKLYADYLQENIFAPLGMKNTNYDFSKKIVKNRAAGYGLANGELVNANFLDMSIPYSAGALYSTTGDLLIWDQSLYTEKILSRKSLDEMFTPFKNNYGYGWDIGKFLERKEINHGGGIFGFATQFSRFTDDKVTVIVLSNNETTNAAKITNSLSSIVFGAPYQIPSDAKVIPAAILEKYVGQYQIAPSFILTVTLEDGKLMTQATGQEKIEIFAESETKFYPKVIDAKITFNLDASGKVMSLTLSQGGRETPAPKIK
jgi:CubicO group peptidase (beta-lactamase class C family)